MTEPRRSADILVNHLLNTPGLLEQVKLNPEDTPSQACQGIHARSAAPAFISDPWTYRTVVLALGIVCVAAMVGHLP
ncbi:MAG TPA: hypothetical protein VGA09_21795 [Candidatus Binatia bacterium]